MTEIICFALGLFIGWVVLPAPKPVQDWWTAHKPW